MKRFVEDDEYEKIMKMVEDNSDYLKKYFNDNVVFEEKLSEEDFEEKYERFIQVMPMLKLKEIIENK